MLKNFLNSPIFLLGSVAVIALAATLFPRIGLLAEAAADFTSPRSMALSEQWTVVSVADGDTITVRRGNERKKIRFCGIDSPEIKHGKQPGQPFGNEAKEKLRSLVATAKNQVIIIPVENDRYGRTIAEVMARGKGGVEVSFQEEMLKSGMAYLYRQYAKNCPNVTAFEQAEKIAIASRAGVWSNLNLQKPWEYRRRYK